MNRMKLIAKKHLTVLMQNEIFADFFNTFLNLPVFGQTPIFMHSTRQWYLWPELPCNLVSKHKGLMNWMEKHRLPFFCKTNLCLHYLLCEELLSFIRSPEAAEMLRWIKADQWLLEKCIGGSRGMWRFRAFMQGMAGEELTKFWLATERILGIDETDESQQDLYESLIQVLMATHLQEGSTVVILCNTTIESLLKMTPYHPQHVRSRREILSEMQKVALFKIESYWLPNFYIHCKLKMEKEPACRHLLEQYEERLHRAGLPKQAVSPRPPMSIRQSSSETQSYCSLESKRKVWDHVTGQGYSEGGKHKESRRKKKSRRSSPAHKTHHHSARHSARHSASSSPSPADQIRDSAMGVSDESPSFKSSPSEFMSSPLANELANAITYNKLRSSTPVVQFPSLLALKTLVKSPMCLDFLPWALTADKCAGRPFREFLLRRDYGLEVHLLDLWHDLEDFLRMMLCSLGEGNILLRHVMGERICELYLTQNSNWHLPLKLTTLRNLQNLLPSGHVIPWVLKAQKEICKILSFLYEDFLQHDDKMFLYYVSGKEKKLSAEEPYEKDENRRLARRITEALHLCQTLAGMRDFELLMGEHWQMMGSQDLGLGGSIFMEAEPVVRKMDYSSMTFEELARLNPKMAVELLSNNFKAFCKSSPSSGVFSRPLSMRRNLHWTRSSLSFMRKGPAARKPPLRPRALSEVLQNPIHLDYFRQFLKMHNAEAPLLFWMAVEELKNEGNPRIQRLQVNDCVRTFFFHSIPPEKLLDCDADIIREIPRAANVTVPMLVTAQFFVMKALEEKWFQMYQGLYPESDLSITAGGRGRRGSLMKEKMRRYWNILGTFIRTVCKFRKAMSYVGQRKRFEDFLHRELKNEKETIQSSPQTRGSFSGVSGRYGSTSEDAEVPQVRRKIFGRLISVNFLVNDLYFYLEMEKFFYLSDSVVVLSSLGLYTEKDIAFLKSKVSTINKLFLNSDIPPKLRVNLTDAQVLQIRNFIAEGVLNRTLYHSAFMSIFPVLLFYWKKYCTWKAMRGFKKPKSEKTEPSPPVVTTKLSRRPSCYTGDYPVIRYTILRGIELLLPQPKEETEELPAEKSSVGSLEALRKSSTTISVPQRRTSSIGAGNKLI
ncbi:regulator of G-protein signaling protein-like isoform X2 [Podarcis raffonei]|uniref:regulator of G-protein signaling protein-like isoform X2 n=1 Tax=Podarcis raffonei TaxID=65483 RepID=UPI0023290E6D|nr:regulator of G-protein signaling protein-like isoform X2 [Podarcis raffonei]